MEKKVNLNTHIVSITIILIVSIGLFLYIKNQDINFCRRVFVGLVEGNHSVHKLIDWANFKAVGVDVGQAYLALPGDKERTGYQKAFIERFSLGFRQAKGTFKSFINWRLYDNRGETVVVAADYKAQDNKTILFTISKDGRKQLAGIQWE